MELVNLLRLIVTNTLNYHQFLRIRSTCVTKIGCPFWPCLMLPLNSKIGPDTEKLFSIKPCFYFTFFLARGDIQGLIIQTGCAFQKSSFFCKRMWLLTCKFVIVCNFLSSFIDGLTLKKLTQAILATYL